MEVLLQCRRPQLDSWVGKIPWRREQLPTPVFGLENSQKVGHNWATFAFSGGLWYCCSLPCPSFSGSLLPSHFRLLMPFYYWWPISSVQSLSHVQLFATPWTAAHQASVSITNSWSLLKLMSIESVMSSNHLILCCPLLLLPSIFPNIRVFSSESVLQIR